MVVEGRLDMRSGLRFVFVAMGMVGAQWLAAQAAKPNLHLHDPRKHVAEATSDGPDFAWRMFVFLNWPELPNFRGIPNPQGRLGQGPTVWESFKNVSEVYKPGGRRPPPFPVWNELPPIPKTGQRMHVTQKQIAALGPVDSDWVHFLAEPAMIDGQQICDSNAVPVQYDVRGNISYFDYVVNNPAGFELFNVQGQQAALAATNFTFDFPGDTLEVKASWRVLEPGVDDSRYWTAIGVYWDTNRVLHTAKIGLTGIHIISKTLPDWVWMTFEQVDNPTATFKYLLGQKGAAVGANPNFDQGLTPINQTWQQALQGTKWQYYALMDVQTEFTNTAQKPTLLSNTQMETYFQPSSSCITCHKLASIGNPQKTSQQLRLKLFYPLNPYVGDVDFSVVANQQFPGEAFKEMDFLWSLRNAQSKTASTKATKAAPSTGQ
jgi:hypothetical protein